jgi:hypothetical protein
VLRVRQRRGSCYNVIAGTVESDTVKRAIDAMPRGTSNWTAGGASEGALGPFGRGKPLRESADSGTGAPSEVDRPFVGVDDAEHGGVSSTCVHGGRPWPTARLRPVVGGWW